MIPKFLQFHFDFFIDFFRNEICIQVNLLPRQQDAREANHGRHGYIHYGCHPPAW